MIDENAAATCGPSAKDRSFISDEPLRNARCQGRAGVAIRVRLTSYRSLPLSCIEAVELTIDGRSIDPDDLRLTLNYTTHKLRDLGKLTNHWWFILDYAELFAPLDQPLAPGLHDVEGSLVTVEPYITAGRFSFHKSVAKRLALESESVWGSV